MVVSKNTTQPWSVFSAASTATAITPPETATEFTVAPSSVTDPSAVRKPSVERVRWATGAASAPRRMMSTAPRCAFTTNRRPETASKAGISAADSPNTPVSWVPARVSSMLLPDGLAAMAARWAVAECGAGALREAGARKAVDRAAAVTAVARRARRGMDAPVRAGRRRTGSPHRTDVNGP